MYLKYYLEIIFLVRKLIIYFVYLVLNHQSRFNSVFSHKIQNTAMYNNFVILYPCLFFNFQKVQIDTAYKITDYMLTTNVILM